MLQRFELRSKSCSVISDSEVNYTEHDRRELVMNILQAVVDTICGILVSSHFDRKAIQQRSLYSLTVRVLCLANLPCGNIQVYFLPQFKGQI